jgi:maltose O-acetyltransferase
MPTEKEKMLAGEAYDPFDPELVAARERARDLCWDLNATRERDQTTRREMLVQLCACGGDLTWTLHRKGWRWMRSFQTQPSESAAATVG